MCTLIFLMLPMIIEPIYNYSLVLHSQKSFYYRILLLNMSKGTYTTFCIKKKSGQVTDFANVIIFNRLGVKLGTSFISFSLNSSNKVLLYEFTCYVILLRIFHVFNFCELRICTYSLFLIAIL